MYTKAVTEGPCSVSAHLPTTLSAALIIDSLKSLPPVPVVIEGTYRGVVRKPRVNRVPRFTGMEVQKQRAGSGSLDIGAQEGFPTHCNAATETNRFSQTLYF